MESLRKFNLILLGICLILALILINFPQISNLKEPNDFLLVVDVSSKNCSAFFQGNNLEVIEKDTPPDLYTSFGRFEAVGERKNYLILEDVRFNPEENFEIIVSCENSAYKINNSNYKLYLFDYRGGLDDN